MRQTMKCPECGGSNLRVQKEKGEAVCRDCGLVIEDKMIDFGQEWREFDESDESSKRRTGAPMTYTKYDQGLATDVGAKGDIYHLGAKGKSKFFRLIQWLCKKVWLEEDQWNLLLLVHYMLHVEGTKFLGL